MMARMIKCLYKDLNLTIMQQKKEINDLVVIVKINK